MNQEESGLKSFVFDCYDTYNQHKITEKSLFRFMNVVSRKVPGVNMAPTELLTLREHDSDMFLDLFVHDFIKIHEALIEKAK